MRNPLFPPKKQLEALGYASYTSYLKSKHWQTVRNLYRLADLPQTCPCGKRPRALHHRHYGLLGREQEDLACLQPICRDCHKLLHGWESSPKALAGRAFRLKERR